ncbi:isochorismatase family protein [Pseudoalteromonas sp. JBTF-M23]|uniref:Isochorismatase family protein n=1 Tax=Pseudoalteromonas caenipelagi TaxID=2726988 RepID=A0A849VCI9_9GAMM|nr:isochorismatase family protein [Pseudoalteromonas caenipelagi]NOU50510.1 isochorismatase family protein [Pseudoalteromonas caenipelagi]
MLNASNCGLLVIDIQGKLATQVVNSTQLIAGTEALILGCKALDLPIVWLEQAPNKLGATVPQLASLLHPEHAITKTTFSGYANHTVAQRIKSENKQYWLVCGIEAHICVYQTARDLLANKFKVMLVEDAISSQHIEHKALALSQLQHNGAQLTNVEMCLYELLADSQHPQFRTILNLIK